jgi:hypothetical protein
VTDDADPLYEDLSRAAEFMADVREEQAASGKTLSGRTNISSERVIAILREAETSNLIRAVADSLGGQQSLQKLFERFEEMCRRRKTHLPDALRPAITRLLAAELFSNTSALACSPDNAVSVTLHCGACAHDLMSDPDFAEFCDAPSIFRQVALSNPSDPRASLKRAQEAIATLINDEEFVEFRDTPKLFRFVAIWHPSDPKAALQKIRLIIAELSADDQFAEFRDTPWIFERVAIHNPTNPKEALKKAKKLTVELIDDPEFAYLRDTPWIFASVAVHNPAHPRDALRKIYATITQLANDEEFSEFRDTPGIFRYVAVYTPSNSREFLMKAKVAIADLMRADEFAEFRDAPGVLRQVVIHNTSDPVAALRRVQNVLAEFRENPATKDVQTSVLRDAAVYYPKRPYEGIKQILAKREGFANRVLSQRQAEGLSPT